MLRAYVERGLVVEGMRMQVLRADVRRSDDRVLVVELTDRLAAATAVGGGHRVALPRDEPSTRTVRLERADGRWVVASVRSSARR